MGVPHLHLFSLLETETHIVLLEFMSATVAVGKHAYFARIGTYVCL